MAVFALGSNSRVRGKRATELLGWAPKRRSITEWIARELALLPSDRPARQ